MIILITVLFLFVATFALVLMHYLGAKVRYIYLVATGSAIAGWLSVLSWRFRLPLSFEFPRWEPTNLFLESLSFTTDSLTWPLAFSVMTFTLAVILTATARDNFPATIAWAATLLLGGFGLLAVLANNPLTLLMIWAAIDLAELAAQLYAVNGPQASEKVVTAFATHIAGIGILLWASMVSISNGFPLDFQNAPSQVGLYLLMAVGLRLGVIPLHLPYLSESAIRRGFGSALRLISAASSLVLLARIPTSSVASVFTPILLSLTALTAIFGGWMWLRAANELDARPFWIIGLSSLAMASALRGNQIGAVAWGCALMLSGGALFLSSVHHTWLSRALWVGMWGISALPFSMTATGWSSSAPSFWPVWPFLLLAQGLLLAGYFRHAMHPILHTNLGTLDLAAMYIYPIGIGLLLVSSTLLGIWGWDGAFKLGTLIPALIGVLLGAAFIWITPRLRVLTPVRAHWVRPEGGTIIWIDWLFRSLWSLYLAAGRLSTFFSNLLEGDSGFMWTLLFLVLFISLMAQGALTP